MPTVRGVDLAVSDVGAGAALFWGHGFASSNAQDERAGMLNWSQLAGRHRIVRWDARGHGKSGGTPEPDDYRWEKLGLDLLALADAMAVERFVAGGVSMGAAVALHAATHAPDRVVGLVLVLPPTAYGTRQAQVDDYLAGAALVEQEGVDRYVEQVVQPFGVRQRLTRKPFRLARALWEVRWRQADETIARLAEPAPTSTAGAALVALISKASKRVSCVSSQPSWPVRTPS